MKKMNQIMMGMLAIAATTLTGCSNDDATSMNSNNSRQNVENFYMRLQVTGNANASGTRTTGSPTENGTEEESTITNGTIWLVDEAGNVKFSKQLTATDWDKDSKATTKPIKVAVTQVKEKTPYYVYFLANKNGDLKTSPTGQFLESTNGGLDHATDNAFVMFNQNDKAVKATSNTVFFTADNKNEGQPAKPASAIQLDRATARIDMPQSTTTIQQDPKKTEKTQNIEAITAVTLQGFTPFNVANKENMEQKWDSNWEMMQLPNELGALYYPRVNFNDGRDNKAQYPEAWLTDKTYVFENTQTGDNIDDATGIFLKYKATASTTANKDFADGTFYRYDKHVFTSIQDIIKYADAANPFGTTDAASIVELIKGEPTEAGSTTYNLTTDESKLAKFREDYNIEVFERGEVYYSYYIEDTHHPGMKFSVLRNSIYRINVTSIYDLGTDTPNSPDVKPNYYLNVEVTVNPWILHEIKVELN